jgi:hypothetical protein
MPSAQDMAWCDLSEHIAWAKAGKLAKARTASAVFILDPPVEQWIKPSMNFPASKKHLGAQGRPMPNL